MLVAALAVVLVTAFVVGAVFDMVDSNSGLARWDRAVAQWGSSNATSWSTGVLDALTDLGATVLLLVIVVAVAAFDVVRHRNVNVVLFLGVVLAGVALVNNALKWLVDRERPDVTHLVGTSGSSFPSGHSAAAAATWFALALVVARGWSRRGRAVAAAIAALISVSVAASPRCSGCTGSPTWSPVWSSAGVGSCSAPSSSVAASSGWASRRSESPPDRRRYSADSATTVSVGRPSSSGSARSSTMRACRPLNSMRHRWLAKNGPSSTDHRDESRRLPTLRRNPRPTISPTRDRPRRNTRRSRVGRTLRIGELTIWWIRLSTASIGAVDERRPSPVAEVHVTGQQIHRRRRLGAGRQGSPPAARSRSARRSCRGTPTSPRDPPPGGLPRRTG